MSRGGVILNVAIVVVSTERVSKVEPGWNVLHGHRQTNKFTFVVRVAVELVQFEPKTATQFLPLVSF